MMIDNNTEANAPKAPLYFLYDEYISQHFLKLKDWLSKNEDTKDDAEKQKTLYRKAIQDFNADVLPIGMSLMRDVDRGVILVSDWDIFGADKDVFVDVLLNVYNNSTIFQNDNITVPKLDAAFEGNKSFKLYHTAITDFFNESKEYLYNNMIEQGFDVENIFNYTTFWVKYHSSQISSYLPTIPTMFYASDGFVYIVGPWDYNEPGIEEEVSELVNEAWVKFIENMGDDIYPDFDNEGSYEPQLPAFPDWVIIDYPDKQNTNPSYVNSETVDYNTVVPGYIIL